MQLAQVLCAAVARQEAPTRENLAALARHLFGPEHGAELDILPLGRAPESIPPDFSSAECERSIRILLDTVSPRSWSGRNRTVRSRLM